MCVHSLGQTKNVNYSRIFYVCPLTGYKVANVSCSVSISVCTYVHIKIARVYDWCRSQKIAVNESLK